MARKGAISELYDIPALQKQQQTAIDFIEDFINKVNSVKPIAVGLQGADKTGTILKGIEDLNAAQAKYTAVSAKAAKAARDEATARDKNASAMQKEAKLADNIEKSKQKEEKARTANQKALDREAAARAKEEKAIIDALNDYNALAKAYNDAALKAKTLAIATGDLEFKTPAVQEAIATAKQYKDILDKVDQSTGNYSRNVGNYASGFNGLNTSLQQILREAPSAAVSLNTFFLAISNNLPMFFDEIGRAKTKLAELKAEGKEGPSVFQQLGKSIFSVGTALTVGVTLLTLFGGKLIDVISSLFKGADATALLTRRVEELRTEFELLNRIKINIFEDFDEANTKLINAAKERGDAEADISKATSEGYKSTADALEFLTQRQIQGIKDLRQGFSFFETDLKTARSAQDFLTSFKRDLVDVNKQIENSGGIFSTSDIDAAKQTKVELEGTIGLLQDLVPALEQVENLRKQSAAEEAQQRIKSAEDLRAANKQAAKNNIEALNNELERIRLAKFKDRKRELEEERDFQKNLAQARLPDGKISLNARAAQFEAEKKLILQQRDFELTNEVLKINKINRLRAVELAQPGLSPADIIKINSDAEAQIRAARLTAKERANLEQDANRDILASRVQLASEIIQIRDDINKQKFTVDDFTAQLDKRAADELKIAEKRIAANEKVNNELATANNNAYANDLITKEQYDEKKLQIENQTARETLLIQIKLYEKIFEIYGQDSEKRTEVLQVIAKLKKELSELDVAGKGIGEKKVRDLKADAQQLKQTFEQIGQELQGLVFDFFTAGITKQKNAIQEQIDLIDERKKKDIEAQNQITQSTADRANNIAIIEANAAAQKEQLQRRQKQLDIEKAKFDKANAITGIVQQTALGVLKASPNVPLMVAIGALGAIQLARVLAQPIPRYAEGTDDHPGGKAVVGDGGKKELILTPDGRYMITQKTPHTVDLPKHSIVLPDAEAAIMHHQYSTVSTVQPGKFQQPTLSLKKEFKQLTQTIKNKKETHVRNVNPVDIWIKTSGSWQQFLK